MAIPTIQTSFAKGEIAPSLFGHVDLAAFHIALSTCRNAYVGYRGGAYSRAGTEFVGFSRNRPDLGVVPPRLITWSFNAQQTYHLEFGEHYLSFIFQGAYVVDLIISIIGISQSNPMTVTTNVPHGMNPGDFVFIEGVDGAMAPYVNGNEFEISAVPTSVTMTLDSPMGFAIDSNGFPAYSGLGTVERVYTIATPYASVDLPFLKFTQSADVMSLTCVNTDTGNELLASDLKRFGPTNWTLTPTDFSTAPGGPAGLSGFATVQPNPSLSPPTLPAAYAYQVTAIDATTGKESLPQLPLNIVNGVDMAATAGSNVINWGQLTGTAYYNVYRAPTSFNTDPGNPSLALPVPVGSAFGFIGFTQGNQFVDNNIIPNFSVTPPHHRNPFARGRILQVRVLSSSGDWNVANVIINSGTGGGFSGQAIIIAHTIVGVSIDEEGENFFPSDTVSFVGDGSSATGVLVISPETGSFPSGVSYFQQRRCYFNTLNQPDTYFMSRPGQFDNFDVSIPVSDGDALSGTPWSEKVDGIQWMLSMPLGLLSFTASGVWQVGPAGTGFSSPAAITPSNQLASPQSSIGCSPLVPPLRVNWDIPYLEYMGSSVLALTYQIFFNIYAGVDISWASSHLLEQYQILQWCYARTPNRLIWSVRNDGLLLSLTYVKEQEVVGWGRHDTQGQFRSITSGPEKPVDSVYFVVERPVFVGGTRYFIERMNNRRWQTVEDPWCVDAGVATLLTRPAANIVATTASGPVTFTAAGAVFGAGDAGKVLRMGGGIAIISSASGASANGTWLVPCQQLLPNDPFGSPLPQPAGEWSIAPQVTVVGGLPHLAERQIVGLADGVPVGPLAVDINGLVTLPFPASDVKLGLQYTAQAQSLPLDAGNPTVQGRRKNIYAVMVRCENSGLCEAGANEKDASAMSPPPLFETWTNLAQGQVAVIEPPPNPAYTTPGGGTAQPLFTGDLRIVIPSEWKKPGQVAVQQQLPLPMNLLALVPETQEGDLVETSISKRPPPQQGQGG